MTPLGIAAVLFAVVGLALALAGLIALLRLRPLQGLTRLLAGALLIAVGTLSGALAAGMLGYRALTHEQVAARISLTPLGPQRFSAVFRFPDGGVATYQLAGDEIYVDAHILKWHPWANLVGLHTSYELARVGGRYVSLEQERAAPRTLHAFTPERPIDLFTMRRRHGTLSILLDAEYGSATFVPASQPKELELRVSTTGLLMREVKPAPGVN